MRSIAVVLSACLLNGVFALPSPVLKGPIFDSREIKFDAPADGSRIVGGSVATSGQFPYMAALTFSNIYLCGAAIVSARYLLSAAHCTTGFSASSLSVLVGTVDLGSGGTTYAISNVIDHPDYSETTVENDISLLRTVNSIVGSSVVASIPIGSTNLGAGVTTTLSGWGRTEGGYPSDLRFIDLPTIDNTECLQSLSWIAPIFTSSLCTLRQAGEGACNGDSGGPLVANGVLVGITSWGGPCGDGYPDVFARVSSYVTWIQENAT